MFDITFFDRCACPKTRDVNTDSHLSHLIEPTSPPIQPIWNLRGTLRPFLKCLRSLTLSSHSLGPTRRGVWHTSCREAPAAHQSTVARLYKYLHALPPHDTVTASDACVDCICSAAPWMIGFACAPRLLHEPRAIHLFVPWARSGSYP